jgi:hypothetical protein
MGKLILLSLLFATMVVPMRAARDASPARGFRRALVWMFSVMAIYLVLLLYVYPRFA